MSSLSGSDEEEFEGYDYSNKNVEEAQATIMTFRANLMQTLLAHIKLLIEGKCHDRVTSIIRHILHGQIDVRDFDVLVELVINVEAMLALLDQELAGLETLGFSFNDQIAARALDVLLPKLKDANSIALVNRTKKAIAAESGSFLRRRCVDSEDMLYMVCVCICTECTYLEFPRCEVCRFLLNKRLPDGQGRCNNCRDVSTQNYWSYCNRCQDGQNRVEWWCIRAEEADYAAKALRQTPLLLSLVLHCDICSVSEFPGEEMQLIGNSNGQPISVNSGELLSPSAWVIFHRSASCQGVQEFMPAFLSLEQLNFLAQKIWTAPRLRTAPVELRDYSRGQLAFTSDKRSTACVREGKSAVVQYAASLRSFSLLVIDPGFCCTLTVGFAAAAVASAVTADRTWHYMTFFSGHEDGYPALPAMSYLTESPDQFHALKHGDIVTATYRNGDFIWSINNRACARYFAPDAFQDPLYPTLILSCIGQSVYLIPESTLTSSTL